MEVDTIIQCDATKGIPLPDKSVHCVITSPPYWGLRDYGVAGQLGLEKTPEEYIERMVGVFRHVWRVLRDDGTCWVNMGDTYCGSGRASGVDFESENWKNCKQATNQGSRVPPSPIPPGLKTKDLCMMPARLAIALQADGWYLRSDIIWAKPNPMPESVTDRPTKSHEHIFLLTKKSKYFYDADAVREEYKQASIERSQYKAGERQMGVTVPDTEKRWNVDPNSHGCMSSGANKRDVWTIPTQSFPEAHFATFPEKLVEPCIKAGTSEKGCCPECGAPWVRIVEHKNMVIDRSGRGEQLGKYGKTAASGAMVSPAESTTIGWKPTCKHLSAIPGYPPPPIPCTVFDPFMGSGTVGLVAYKLRRHYIGTELSAEYIKMAEKRIGAEKDKYSLIEP